MRGGKGHCRPHSHSRHAQANLAEEQRGHAQRCLGSPCLPLPPLSHTGRARRTSLPGRELQAEILGSHLQPPGGRSSASFWTWHASTVSAWSPCPVSAGLSLPLSPLPTLWEKQDERELAAQAPRPEWGPLLTEQPQAAPRSLPSPLLTSPGRTEPRSEPGLA